jgi:hypothetical protein
MQMFSSSAGCVFFSWHSFNTLADVGDKVTISETPDVYETMRSFSNVSLNFLFEPFGLYGSQP